MKRTIAIALLLTALTAQALPRHTLVAIPRSTWQDASPAKRDKMVTFFQHFQDPDSDGTIGVTRYVHTPSGTQVFMSFYWTRHLLKYKEQLTQAKIDTVKAQLNDNNIRIKFTDDIQAQLTAWQLVPYVPEGGVTNGTTTTVSATTTTTTTGE